MDKKQIVFIEPQATVNSYRIARSLRLTEKYETILFSFSKVDRDFYGKAYDKIFDLELSHKLKFKNLVNLFKKMLSKEKKYFFKKIEEMNPYIFQITGPDLFTLMALLHLKKSVPKIYYANDIWGAEKRSFLFRTFKMKGEFQRICEKICFRMVDGILNKSSPKQFESLNYDVPVPRISLHPSPLDEWTFSPKKKKNKEIHIAHGGCPTLSLKTNVHFLEVIKILAPQKIYLHSFGPCAAEKENLILLQESKENKYYCPHKKVSPYVLNKEMSEYTFGIFADFWMKTNSNPGVVKTDMGTKMTNYIEAGLPIIVSEQMEYIADIVNEQGIGFVVKFKDLKNLKKIIEKQNYSQLQKNVKKFQEKFKMSVMIKEIESFYEQVIRLKKEQ